jgi:hypothetical protein
LKDLLREPENLRIFRAVVKPFINTAAQRPAAQRPAGRCAAASVM